MSNSDPRPDVFNILKAILLPGSDTVQDFASEVWMEAEETKWSESLNRIEGLALLLTVFASTLLGATLIFINGWIGDLVKVIGLPTTAALLVATPLLYMYGIIYVFRRIDAGESVLMSFGDIDSGDAKKVKMLLGGFFLSASIVMSLSLETDIVETLFILLISLVIVGPLIIGLTYWIRLAISE